MDEDNNTLMQENDGNAASILSKQTRLELEERGLRYRIDRHARILVLMFPLFVIFGAFAINEHNFGEDASMRGLILICSAALLTALYQLVQIIRKKRRLRIIECEKRSEEEALACKKKIKRHDITALVLTLAVLLGGISFYAWRQHENHLQVVAVYEQAVALVDNGAFEKAKVLLEQIEEEGYQDTEPLICLCKAHHYVSLTTSENDFYYNSAYNTMEDVVFHHQTPEQMATINAFLDELEHHHQELEIIIQQRKEELEREREKERARKAREEAEKNKKNWYYTGGYYSSSSSRRKSYGDDDEDPYYADEFADPEDFYDWYAEDFDSYEDAEDYYYSHTW